MLFVTNLYGLVKAIALSISKIALDKRLGLYHQQNEKNTARNQTRIFTLLTVKAMISYALTDTNVYL